MQIEPTILKGTRDFTPKEVNKRNLIFSKLKKVFEKYNFDNIETPILTPAETILGKYGEEGDRLTYSFKDNGDRMVALPYDLTVPFARYVSSNFNRLTFPFKRYQIQRVWRAEKPQKGRLREFYQCDVDIIGSNSLFCEFEMLKIMIDVFQELRLPNIIIKINSRKLLNSLLEKFNVSPEQSIGVIRIIDKLDKIGVIGVKEELRRNGFFELDSLIDLLQPEKYGEDTLKKLKEFEIKEIVQLFGYIRNLGLDTSKILFDPSLARGLDYYTGIIFEVISKDLNVGSICGGGRYDNLTKMFIDKHLPGIGVSFGFERIMLVIEHLEIKYKEERNKKIIVLNFDPIATNYALSAYNYLLERGVQTEFYFDVDKISKQLSYANKKEIDYVVICGGEELHSNKLRLKNMQSGYEKVLGWEEIVENLL